MRRVQFTATFIMIKSFYCLVIVSLSLVISSASASLQPRPMFIESLNEPAITDVIDRAHELLGTPYKWGGTSEDQGFDCSSFLVYLFKTEANIHIPRTTVAMHRSKAATIKRNALKPGDRCFSKAMAAARSAMWGSISARANSFTRRVPARTCASTR